MVPIDMMDFCVYDKLLLEYYHVYVHTERDQYREFQFDPVKIRFKSILAEWIRVVVTYDICSFKYKFSPFIIKLDCLSHSFCLCLSYYLFIE